MSLHNAAQHLASQGRYGDNMLVHMNPREVAGLQALAEQKGTKLTINPQTGMPEAFGLGDLNPFRIVQGKGEIGESGLGGLLIGAALNMAFPGLGALNAGLLTGGATLAMGGNARQAIGQGLGAYGGASMMGGAGATPHDPNAVPVSDAVATPVAPAAAPVMPAAPTAPTEYFGNAGTAQGIAQGAPVATATPMPAAAGSPINIGFGPDKFAPSSDPTFWDKTKAFGKEYAWPIGGLAAYSLLNEEPKGVEPANKIPPGKIRPYIYDPKTGGLTQLRPYDAPGYAEGGPVEQMSRASEIGMNTGYPQADITGHAYATPWQTPVSQNVVQGTADTGVNRMSGQMLAEGGITGNGSLSLNIPLDIGGGRGGPQGANGYQAAGSGNGSSFTAPSVSGGMFGQAAAGGYGRPMDPQTMSRGLDQRAVAANPQGFQQFLQQARQREQQYPGSTMLAGLYAGQPAYKQTYEQYLAGRSPLQQDVQLTRQQFENPTPSAAMSNPNYAFARGGTAYASGGISDLGGYSDGGRLLKGPGDGVSDSIPATIAGRQPARLADGEFVVPARIVSELGNGSTDAGARKLYAMMDRVQKARGKTTGKNRVAANTRSDKYLPA